MAKLLHLDSGASPDSLSRLLNRGFVDAWPGEVTYRDLHADPLPHLEHSDLHWPEAMRTPGSVPPAAQALTDELVGELLAADALLVGAPMYNYSLPSTLKAWIDRIHLPGVTTGPGTTPLAGRPAVVVSPRGLAYDAGDTAGWDHCVPVLQVVLGEALGMDVQVVTVSYTLADTVPDLAEHAERYHAELASARARLAELARAI